jgi:hypothetical protein
MMGACGKGVHDVREALSNRTPLEFSCTEFMSRKPINTWVLLTGASGSLQDAAYRTRNNVPDRLYIPMRCPASPGPVRIVMATEEPGLLAALTARQPTDVRRDVRGMVRTREGHDTGTTTGGNLDGGCAQCTVKIQNLAPDYLVIEDGHDPSAPRGVAWLAGAIVGLVFLAKIVRS